MEVKYEFDPLELVGITADLTKAQRSAIMDEVAAYVQESVLSMIGDSKSPVTGRKFPLLSKEYAKEFHGGNRTSHLELEGDLLDSLVVKKKGNVLILTVSEDQQGKADGHNNFSGKSQLPLRQFIPKEDQTFVPSIREGIKSIIRDAIET